MKNEGAAAPCFVTSWLAKIDGISPDNRGRYLEVPKFASGTAYLAGYETTTSTILNFVLYMVQYPEVQRKAQAELDRVVRRGRMPDFSDRENLPYIVALFKEVLRFHPSVPLGIAHSLIVDDEYEGMRIHKGSLIFPNAWAMMARSEKEYGPDANVFRPERFLNSDVLDPQKYVFGFGRRICPGRYIAVNSAFIAMCLILQILWIDKAKNEDGSEKPVEPAWKTSLATCLHPFPCSFTLRFEGAEKLIDASE